MRASIDGARDFDALRSGLARAYADTSPRALAGRLVRGLALCELAAYLSIVQGYPAEVRALELNASSRWRVPALFTRAVEWFRKKVDDATAVPVQWEVGERAQRRAGPVAAAAPLDAANRLIRHIESQRDKGAPLEQVKTELRHALSDHGLTPGARPLVESEPIREELQTAFAQGRREILSLDFYRAAYPFWRYNSVLDDRTTEGCRELNGLVLPAKDPRWVGFTPPRHWRCRAHLDAITHSEGVKAPKRKPIEQYAGEGTFATLNEEWEPRPENYPPDLWEIYVAAKGIESPHIELDGPWWRKGEQ